MDDLYLDTILDLYKHPQHCGQARPANKLQSLKSSRAINASCGDCFEVSLIVEDGLVVDAKWQGQGCAISSAAMDQVCGWMIGKSTPSLQLLSKQKILDLLGLETIIPAREKCALLALSLQFTDD